MLRIVKPTKRLLLRSGLLNVAPSLSLSGLYFGGWSVVLTNLYLGGSNLFTRISVNLCARVKPLLLDTCPVLFLNGKSAASLTSSIRPAELDH